MTVKGRQRVDGVSKYADTEEMVFIETEIARGKSTEEIRESLRGMNAKYVPMKDLVINHMIGAVRTNIVNRKLNDVREREASVENYEERTEEKEKRYFGQIFENNLAIEKVKEEAIKFFQAHPEKIRPKDYKDLSIAQAIGTRDLRDYKIRKAGRLDSYTGEQLEAVKVKMIEVLLRKKGGGVERKREVIVETPGDEKIIDMEADDDGVFKDEQEIGEGA